MRHQNRIKNLARPKSERDALIISQAKSLIEYGKLQTTKAKASVTGSFVDRVLSRVSQYEDDTKLLRYLESTFKSKKFAEYVVKEIKPKLPKKVSGFMKVYKMDYRKGDNADMRLLMIDYGKKPEASKKTKDTKKSKSKKKAKKS